MAQAPGRELEGIAHAAARACGAFRDPALRHVCAREMALDLWLSRADLTVDRAKQVLRLIRDELASSRNRSTRS